MDNIYEKMRVIFPRIMGEFTETECKELMRRIKTNTSSYYWYNDPQEGIRYRRNIQTEFNKLNNQPITHGL